jgi:hypothetical protein
VEPGWSCADVRTEPASYPERGPVDLLAPSPPAEPCPDPPFADGFEVLPEVPVVGLAGGDTVPCTMVGGLPVLLPVPPVDVPALHASGTETGWSVAGTVVVAMMLPLESRASMVHPAIDPVVASTATEPTGDIESPGTVAPAGGSSRIWVTPVATETAAHPDTDPSAWPNSPLPSSSRAPDVGVEDEMLTWSTAATVENSRTSGVTVHVDPVVGGVVGSVAERVVGGGTVTTGGFVGSVVGTVVVDTVVGGTVVGGTVTGGTVTGGTVTGGTVTGGTLFGGTETGGTGVPVVGVVVSPVAGGCAVGMVAGVGPAESPPAARVLAGVLPPFIGCAHRVFVGHRTGVGVGHAVTTEGAPIDGVTVGETPDAPGVMQTVLQTHGTGTGVSTGVTDGGEEYTRIVTPPAVVRVNRCVRGSGAGAAIMGPAILAVAAPAATPVLAPGALGGVVEAIAAPDSAATTATTARPPRITQGARVGRGLPAKPARRPASRALFEVRSGLPGVGCRNSLITASDARRPRMVARHPGKVGPQAEAATVENS